MKQSLQHKINKMHTADTSVPSRKSVSMESLTENTLSDDEKGEAAAKRLHEKALYAEQERPMTIGEKSVVAILYAICTPCFAATIVSFFVILILNFTKSGPDVCKTMLMFSLLYLAVGAILLLILALAMKVFPNTAKKLDVLMQWDIVCAILPVAAIIESLIYFM